MLITSTISADLRAPGFPPLVYAVQGEQYSRQITMHLYDGGLPWTVPGGVYIAMRYSKPDGTKGYYDTLPDGSPAWSVSGSTVNVFVAPQMLTVPGFVIAQLEIIQNQSILASFSLRLKVEANPAATLTQSEDYVNWLKWMEDQLKEALKDAADSGKFTGPAPTLEVNTTQYQAGTSPKTPPSGKWLDNVPSVPQGQYLWTKHTSKWNNSSPVTEYSVAYQGQDGADAQLETDTVDYQIGTSGDTPPSGQWSTTIPAPQPGKYFWTRRTKKWNTGTAKVDYSVAYAGTNGTPATVQTQKLEYQVGADGKTPPSGAWSPEIPTVPQGQYLWMRYTVQFNTGSPTVIQMPTYQGINGKGAVSSVAGISPDSQGNVPLSASDVGALATTGGEMIGPIKMNGQPISGLNPPKTETEPVTKGDGDARYLQKAGGVPVPERDDHAVNRGYVKNAVDTLGISGASRANSVVVERDLGTVFTPEQSEDIRSGKFDIVRVGCYWTINGRKYWAAHADYRLRCGDTELTTHHMLVIPDKSLFNMAWNETDDTTGGYVNSKVKTEGMAQALEIIKGDFGADHILPYRTILTNAVTNGMSSGLAWYDSQVDLMNEKMVYGSHAWGGGSQKGYNTGADKSQIALFKARHDLITNRENWWLRDVQSAATACSFTRRGDADAWSTSNVLGVRPAFLIY